MYTAKDFGNTLIDMSILVLLATALARLQKKNPSIARTALYLGLSATVILAFDHWELLSLLKPRLNSTYHVSHF